MRDPLNDILSIFSRYGILLDRRLLVDNKEEGLRKAAGGRWKLCWKGMTKETENYLLGIRALLKSFQWSQTNSLNDVGFKRRDAYDPETMVRYLPKGWKDQWKAMYAAVFSRPREIRVARPGMAEFLLRVETVVKNLEERVASSFIFRVLFYVLLYTSVVDVLRVTLLTADQLWPFEILTDFDDPVVALFSVLVALPLYIFFFVYRLICPLIVSYTLYKLVRHPESYKS
ncbi:hypothetical protein R1flu_024099 [Riccia fluitans]|uniref:Uncharacterized protein n=1 Tax=Riccia fluitans TaxID=41844 RepID=A0ABD1XTY1_9MARC